MNTLNELHYHERRMPNGCWNCKWKNFMFIVACTKASKTTRPGSRGKIEPPVKCNGICDDYKKEST